MTECSRRAATTTRFTEHGFKSKIKVKEDTPVYSKKKDQNEWKSATLQVKPLENTAKPVIVNLNMVHAIH